MHGAGSNRLMPTVAPPFGIHAPRQPHAKLHIRRGGRSASVRALRGRGGAENLPYTPEGRLATVRRPDPWAGPSRATRRCDAESAACTPLMRDLASSQNEWRWRQRTDAVDRAAVRHPPKQVSENDA